jgi:hypothetical protein
MCNKKLRDETLDRLNSFLELLLPRTQEQTCFYIFFHVISVGSNIVSTYMRHRVIFIYLY